MVQRSVYSHKVPPLSGRRVVVTRPREPAGDFVQRLSNLGTDVISGSVTRIRNIKSPELNKLVRSLSNKKIRPDWIIFLSVNGVQSFTSLVSSDLSRLVKTPVCAVGPATAKEARRKGWNVKKTAGEFNYKGVISALGEIQGQTIIVPRVSRGPRDVIQSLKKHGAHVIEISAYESVPVPLSRKVRRTILSGVDAVAFTASSIVRSFFSNFSKRERRIIFRSALAVSIGPKTTTALRAYGIKRILQPEKSTVADMAAALSRYLKRIKKDL